MNFKFSTKWDVVGIGASPLDIVTLADHFPTQREVQQSIAIHMNGGGPVGTALAVLGKFGANVIMIDKLSDDLIGKTIINDFQKYHVNTEHIIVENGKVSPSATILVEQASGKRAIFFHTGTISDITDITPFKSIIENTKILHVNGRHFDILPQALKIAKNAGVKISFDGGADRYSSNTRYLAKNADICIVAKDFAEKYTGEKAVEKELSYILSKGAQIAGVTMGDKGSYIMDTERNCYYQPAFNMAHVVDTTGCGDSYHGGFLYGLLQGLPIEKCMETASAVAALNTQGIGGRGNLPDINMLNMFYYICSRSLE